MGQTLTTVVHAVEPADVYSAEVQTLAYDLIEIGYAGGNRGDAVVLVEGQRPVVHDGLVIIWRVQICDEVVLILVEIVLLPCQEKVALPRRWSCDGVSMSLNIATK